MKTPSRFITLRALLVLGTVIGCKESSGPPAPRGAANLTVQSGNGQGANAGTAVALPLSVFVTDANNAPLKGVAVTFAVKSGGGTITGGAASTGDDGIATAGIWTLGNNLGTNTVEATVTGLPAVTFTATGRCVTSGALVLDGTLSGILATSDCRYSGGYLTDRYTFTTSAQQAVRFSQTSQIFDTYLEIYDAASSILAANDDSAGVQAFPTSSLKIFLAPGTYELSPSSFLEGRTGDYSLAALAVPESANICELIFAMPGITTVGELATGDCATTATTPFLAETIAIFMRATRTYTVTITSSVFDPFLELYAAGGGPPVVPDDRATGTTARITFTPTTSTFFVIYASTAVAGASGAYTLAIQ